MIEETEQALQLLGQFLKRYEVSHVIFYLDAPVSNSKRLKSSILSMMKAIPLSVEVELVPNADVLLVNKEYVEYRCCYFRFMPELLQSIKSDNSREPSECHDG